MKPVVLYFSRTGNTKGLAEAIAQQAKAPIFSISSNEPSVVEAYDTVILGTPVEGASPAKETRAFVERLPQAQDKRAILFCTYRIFGNERTMKALEKVLAEKGYKTVLKVSKKTKKPGEPSDFSELLGEVKKALSGDSASG
jgi:flavodoxin